MEDNNFWMNAWVFISWVLSNNSWTKSNQCMTRIESRNIQTKNSQVAEKIYFIMLQRTLVKLCYEVSHRYLKNNTLSLLFYTFLCYPYIFLFFQTPQTRQHQWQKSMELINFYSTITQRKARLQRTGITWITWPSRQNVEEARQLYHNLRYLYISVHDFIIEKPLVKSIRIIRIYKYT